ncbi:MAG TPA: sugar phosphate nucleotidyltransferase [Burkholderiales bacterium]|nr:sugar phosphate nucleotidyltransferase [Burkholderiales bacterium]
MVGGQILAFVLAGGEGTRLQPLTRERAKPALGFAGGYRLIDFVLSNLVNSGVEAIHVLAQYKPDTIARHVAAVWGPRVSVLLPRSGDGGGYSGTASAVLQNMDVVERARPGLVAVFAADHVYRMDLRQMAAFHRARGAQASVAAVAVPIESAQAFGLIAAGPDGRVREFQEKPQRPRPLPGDPHRAYASMGNYLFDPAVLAQALRDMTQRGGNDFGHDVLPQLARRYRVFAYDLAENVLPGVRPYEEPAYWRDVGTLAALIAARKDVQGARPRFNLRNPSWPIHGHPGEERSAA